MEKTLNLVKNDPWLEPFAGATPASYRRRYVSRSG